MDLWDKMLSNITEAVHSKKVKDEELLAQMKEALEDEKRLWIGKQASFIEPCEAKEYQDNWNFLYSIAKKKTRNILFTIVLSGQEICSIAQKFVENYELLSSKVHEHNNCLAKEIAIDAERMILPLEGKKLDNQQMCCIVKEVHNHLVLAGAGTGKTTTIIGYVKYLIKNKKCTFDDILVLSFTNASASEMNERLNKEIGVPIKAQTFHKLGLDIITAVQGKKPKIYSLDLRQFVRLQLNELIKNPEYLFKLCIYLAFNGNTQKSIFDFQTNEEYEDYIKYNPPITFKKERVKSYGEVDIANFLTLNEISYVYEKEYFVDTRTKEFGQYHPDFYLPDYDVYIEYFGIDRQGKVPKYFSGKDGMSATHIYQKQMKWKRELHKQNNTCMIEIYAYEKFEGKLLIKLEERLKAVGVIFKPIPPEKMWRKISGTENQKLDRVAELFSSVINLTKNNNCTLDDVRNRNKRLQNLFNINDVIDLIEPIFNNYQNMLQANNEIDFNDMINLASEYIRQGKFIHSYKYIIIDEYQDISQSRYRLLYQMRQQKDYNLFCVGDDWQSIYRFNGSDIGFILNFEKYWGACETSYIETTYRFSSSMISISSNFIMKNPEQKIKKLQSAINNQRFSLEKITAYTEENSISFLSERLNELPKGSTVLFLGRYRFDIKMFDGQSQFSYHYNAALKTTIVIYSKRPDLKISFMTIHGSKGLQADYVFVLNNKNYGMGFPSKIIDAPILQLLLDNCDNYPFAEERRLFYVAITRAKSKVYLITLKNNESVFVRELDEAYHKKMLKEQYTCPKCGGRLIRKNGPYGEFYGCSNYNVNGCRYKRNINKK